MAEIKGLKYQRTLIITFSKDIGNEEREFVPKYFGSSSETIMI